jgi:hypothetical protein
MTTNYDKYLSTNAGKHLLSQHSLEEEGLWRVLGEDPNCDMHGSHYKPEIGFFQGKLENIIEYAVEHKQFWQWGAGGEITKIRSQKIDGQTTAERARLRNIKRALEDELHNINQRLGDL